MSGLEVSCYLAS